MYTCVECEFNGNHEKCIQPDYCECAKDNHYGELKITCKSCGKEFDKTMEAISHCEKFGHVLK